MVNHALNNTNMHSINIYLNSDKATVSLSDAHKIFILSNPIFAESSNIKLLVGLTSFTCPNSIYNIIDGINNSITIDSVEYTIAEGNYDVDTLTTALNAVVSQTFVFNEGDNNFTISSGSSFTINSSTMNKVLGFSDDLPFTGTSLTGSHIVDLAGTTNLNLQIKNLSMNNLDSSGGFSNIIASINNTVNYGDYIFFNPSEVLYHGIHDKNIKLLEIKLIDQNEEEINLNGASFQLVLTIHYTYIREAVLTPELLTPDIFLKSHQRQAERAEREKKKTK